MKAKIFPPFSDAGDIHHSIDVVGDTMAPTNTRPVRRKFLRILTVRPPSNGLSFRTRAALPSR